MKALPEHTVWVYDAREKKARYAPLRDLFGHEYQFMGIFPMPQGDCPGYLAGPGCWYKEYTVDFVFDLRVSGGFVFTRTASREAGVWSGVPE